MQEIIACDVNGNSITGLVQWDSDIHIYLSDPGIDKAYQVHFFNHTMDEALVANSTFSSGRIKVKIPNDLLTQPYIIIGYVNVTKNEESRCIYGFRINIRKKPKPSNYIYVESNDYVSLEKVHEECRQFAENALNSANLSGDYAKLSRSYAIGGTASRENEERDNSKYYCEQSKQNAKNASQSAEFAENSNRSAGEYAGSASNSAGEASDYASKAKEYANQVAADKQEIDGTIKNSLLASSEEILSAMQDYFKRAEELYRSCTIICDGEVPARRIRTIVEIDCHTPQRRKTGYIGIDFDGGTPAIRLLGE